MSFRSRGRLLKKLALPLTLALAGPVSAQPQEPVLVRIGPPADASSLPSGLGIVIESRTGSVTRIRGAIRALDGLAGFTLESSLVETLPKGGLAVTYGAQLSESTAGGSDPRNELTVQFRGAAGSASSTGPSVLAVEVLAAPQAPDLSDPTHRPQTPADDGRADSHGGSLIWDVAVADFPDSELGPLELRFAPASSSERLQGEPDHLFNKPALGEDLVLLLPVLEPGTTLEQVLTVRDRDQPGLVWMTGYLKVKKLNSGE